LDPATLAGLETFAKITGPFGICGILLYILWYLIRHKEKDAADLAILFEAFLVRFTEHDTVCKAYQRELADIMSQVSRNRDSITQVQEEGKRVADELRRVQEMKIRAGRAGM
jgi:hypothetical protein